MKISSGEESQSYWIIQVLQGEATEKIVEDELKNLINYELDW
jgi:hypothetical protein